MNKLYVALKLLMLLNDRKSIDSGLVAAELSVSLRTAQRYLNELSCLPCVITSEGANRTYGLSPDYRLNQALVNGGAKAPASSRNEHEEKGFPLHDLVCKVCGNECEPSGIVTGAGLATL